MIPEIVKIMTITSAGKSAAQVFIIYSLSISLSLSSFYLSLVSLFVINIARRCLLDQEARLARTDLILRRFVKTTFVRFAGKGNTKREKR
jgi:hypothetical protein